MGNFMADEVPSQDGRIGGKSQSDMEAVPGRKYWEIIADRLSAAGWSLGWVPIEKRDFEGWRVDAHKDGQRHYVEAEDINAAFLELEKSIRDAAP